MINKIISKWTLAATLILMFQSAAYSIPSKWEKTETSLTELLNSGWQLMGMASNRVAYQNSFGPGGLNEETYSFFITKNGKYIVCIAPSPVSPVTNIGCRKLN
jgi:hypothetical protein